MHMGLLSSRSVFAVICAASMMCATSSFAAATDDASKYVESLASKVVTIISSKASKEKKKPQIEQIFRDNVDIPWVGRFVMGRFWRQANDAQKTKYLKEYEDFLVTHYASRFSDYSSGTFKITGAHDDGENEFTISMQMQAGDAGAQPVSVDYRVRANGKGFKVFDVIVEGVSMITTQRSEFASVIGSHDIDYLITQLANKTLLPPTEKPAQP